ncbi:MAG TPA: hypothetical protein VD861_07165, partial [Pyrinomonadaceae bacterium]|nr:hypothetical protein [Pyrinomonadaceae bacterium]
MALPFKTPPEMGLPGRGGGVALGGGSSETSGVGVGLSAGVCLGEAVGVGVGRSGVLLAEAFAEAVGDAVGLTAMLPFACPPGVDSGAAAAGGDAFAFRFP